MPTHQQFSCEYACTYWRGISKQWRVVFPCLIDLYCLFKIGLILVKQLHKLLGDDRPRTGPLGYRSEPVTPRLLYYPDLVGTCHYVPLNLPWQKVNGTPCPHFLAECAVQVGADEPLQTRDGSQELGIGLLKPILQADVTSQQTVNKLAGWN